MSSPHGYAVDDHLRPIGPVPAFEGLVVVAGVVVERDEPTDAGECGKALGVVDPAVTPPDPDAVLGVIVLSVVDQHGGFAREVVSGGPLGPVWEPVGAKSGLGYLIWSAWSTFAVEQMYVGLFVIAIIGFLITLTLNELERVIIPWKAE